MGQALGASGPRWQGSRGSRIQFGQVWLGLVDAVLLLAIPDEVPWGSQASSAGLLCAQ
ncbi:MAG: hypothetical protein RLZ55_488 [Actinomycetota bacterium]|jgi:hypothetical protein